MKVARVGVLVGVMVLALAGTAGAATGSAGGAGTQAAGGTEAAVVWYPKHVKSTVSDVRVFTSATGQNIYGLWGACTNFYTDRNDGGRYHVLLTGSVDAWVTASSAYVADGHC
ncbi:hypothetical protein LV79_004483 [Actinokineospora globicatena]|uniref:Secreted protein n=1 Tax=Actinokineospora globicatena TaxID=103729 RepID=A0A9W6QNR0_9PSEU|nr:hypothetical protein [Actinokineospora globicatena]GLW77848.1 hypothetical protein Aglo01_23300 [Actinokineospora globicatena]GLW85484.1 hypothetical protein Aglo02_31240 [Actinokineospora globicatena]GLW94231.1 hypothetical protein Aglo03_50470 [Actinokineospora globicatena]